MDTARDEDGRLVSAWDDDGTSLSEFKELELEDGLSSEVGSAGEEDPRPAKGWGEDEVVPLELVGLEVANGRSPERGCDREEDARFVEAREDGRIDMLELVRCSSETTSSTMRTENRAPNLLASAAAMTTVPV